jgi:hypothetical protein
MSRVAMLIVKIAAVIGLMGLTMGLSANPDPERTGAANDGGTSGPGSDDGSSNSGSGCSK